MLDLVAIATGGAIGALLRYGIAVWTRNLFSVGSSFPLGTFIANLLGAFLMGVLFQLIQKSSASGPHILLATTGFLGALTTFSTFALEGVVLFRNGEPGMAAVYIILTNVLGLAAVAAGIWLAGGMQFAGR